MIRKIIITLFSSIIFSQIALPTFQGVHKAHSSDDSELYSFSSHTFTNCSETGRFGPTLSDCRSDYETEWDATDDYYNMTDQGIQEWVVPKLTILSPSLEPMEELMDLLVGREKEE